MTPQMIQPQLGLYHLLRITTSINIPKPHSLELLLQEKHIHGGCMEQTQPASAVQLQEHSLAIQVLLQSQLPPNSQSMTVSKSQQPLSTSAQPPTEHFSGLKQQTLLAPSSAVQLTPEDLTGGMLTLIQELTAGLRKIIW